MCYADYDRAQQDISAEAQLLVEQGKLTPSQAEVIDTDAVAYFFNSDLYTAIKQAKKVMRESRFIFEVPASDIDSTCESSEMVVLQGVADCVIFDEDSLTVVDFKTDRNVTEEELVQRYTRQLHLYARAFSGNYKLAVKECLVYSFWLKKVVKIPI